MAEPTTTAKLDAARARIKADMLTASENQLKIFTSIFWSQVPFLPKPEALGPLVVDLLSAADLEPGLQDEVTAQNMKLRELAERIRNTRQG